MSWGLALIAERKHRADKFGSPSSSKHNFLHDFNIKPAIINDHPTPLGTSSFLTATAAMSAYAVK
jgi:hypothetical protein